ncbi:hypothetical protein H257_15695 [Aphanomyces astaci]|uniref:Uncharacterized protein n=1 Tax=Aphanomyces astaci TaxID=112090 RepID=W4FNF4_APHAT|nr:hypothetical protein H257_15695 [Aphanomyces astaci]ETV68379.1 hypothetical protein H257_15695 [Aphanomyces astaci]|eukprot:XP_009842174.1 hypothetical protein H257_15695 [Aphanomyces astaci]
MCPAWHSHRPTGFAGGSGSSFTSPHQRWPYHRHVVSSRSSHVRSPPAVHIMLHAPQYPSSEQSDPPTQPQVTGDGVGSFLGSSGVGSGVSGTRNDDTAPSTVRTGPALVLSLHEFL